MISSTLANGDVLADNGINKLLDPGIFGKDFLYAISLSQSSNQASNCRLVSFNYCNKNFDAIIQSIRACYGCGS